MSLQIKSFVIFIICLFQMSCSVGQNTSKQQKFESSNIQLGNEQFAEYLPLIKQKRVGLIVNHTSLVKNTHLVDSLLSLGIQISKIFAPEHGFRGMADAGETFGNGKDKKTGISIISLYGKHKKPTKEDFEDLDIIIFDIQDVGARFYTYISTLHYVMDACAENNKKLLVLDRPNPNAHYVDGPILEPKFKSFVGLDPLPVVYGMTIGELAKMINGEGWLDNKQKCDLTVINCKNYQHSSQFSPNSKPSPNLPNYQSMILYPSICFFEGTNISVGRGTDMQFQVIGGTDKSYGKFSFTPVDKPGANNPPNEGLVCYGEDLRNVNVPRNELNLSYLFNFYKNCPDKSTFFLNTNHFNLLAGNETFKQMLIEGKSESEIRTSWKKDLDAFKTIRSKYLIYAE